MTLMAQPLYKRTYNVRGEECYGPTAERYVPTEDRKEAALVLLVLLRYL
jgi:hypothetical protein